MKPLIAVICGGTSSEREVSLGSGRACALALARVHPTRLFATSANELPADLDPSRHVVFSTLHGTFGEDGGMQRLLDAAGVEYAGCGARASELTMDKTRTKETVAERGVQVAKGIRFDACSKPDPTAVVAELGTNLVVKPNAEGSSVGLSFVSSLDELAALWMRLAPGSWLIESRVVGRELSVGVVNGRALGVVEIRPRSGIYDFASKYTKGLTEYLAPAPLDAETTEKVRAAAETSFQACGCRDYARVDFILSPDHEPFLLEINTLPGMKETSLLPMSARCAGRDFSGLVREMVTPALQRFNDAQSLVAST